MAQSKPARRTLLPAALAAAAVGYAGQQAFSAGVLSQHATHEVFAGNRNLMDTRSLISAEARERVTLEAKAASAEAPAGRIQHGSHTMFPAVAALVGLAGRFRRGLTKRRAGDVEAPAAEEESAFVKASTAFCNLFAVWLAIAAIAAVNVPATFTWVESSYFTGLLGLLMFSVGITTTIDDFKECLKRPGAIAINFISCYGIMPVLAYILAKAIGAEGAILAGMVLVGSINGGQASNLCTLIAGGDVALSVLMTTSTTLGCIFMTPLICKLVLGAVVPVDAMGIVVSTFQVVLAPIFAGVGLNTLAPKLCKSVGVYTPVIGVISTVLLVGASVAKCAAPIKNAGMPLQFACMALHLFGGILGFFATKAVGYDERTCRTVAIETAMKSSAFGFLLASLHFGAFNVRVPSAVSVVWMAIVGSVLAVYWKGQAIKA